MASFRTDQAENLRQMFGAPKARVVTFLSAAVSSEKSQLMINLAAALSASAVGVLVVDSHECAQSVSTFMGLPQNMIILESARQNKDADDIVRKLPHGFSLTTLSRESLGGRGGDPLSDNDRETLERAFSALAKKNDLIMVDAQLNRDGKLPLRAMEEGEIVVQMSAGREAIKSAYALIKQLSTQIGRRSLGIVVTNAQGDEAAQLFGNLARTASQFLGIELFHLGCVPFDEYLAHAVKLHRPVVEAFPAAKSSASLREIASEHFNTDVRQSRQKVEA